MNFRAALPRMQDELILEPVECLITRRARPILSYRTKGKKAILCGISFPRISGQLSGA